MRILFLTVLKGERQEMPGKEKAAKAAEPKKNTKKAPKKVTAATPREAQAAVEPKKAKAARTKPANDLKLKAKKTAEAPTPTAAQDAAQLLSSEVVFQCPLFRIVHDKLIEPGGRPSERDIIRHNGSVVILAIDSSKSKRDPWIVLERQYRHAANQYLWELPAGKLDAGEESLAGAKRELAEETGYSAKKWKPLVTYYASPGFLGESMIVFQAEGLVAGDARPEEDEKIEFRLVKLNEVLKMIDKGEIKDGKTLTSVLLYSRKTRRKGKK